MPSSSPRPRSASKRGAGWGKMLLRPAGAPVEISRAAVAGGAVQRADTVRAAPTRRCPRGGGGGGVRGCGARAGRIDPAPQEVGQEGIGSVVGAQRRGARARGGLVRAEARIDTVGVVPTGRADPAIGAAARSETRRVRERVRRVARRPSPGERPARLVGVATRGRGMLRTEVARLDLLHRRATRDSALGTRERLEQPRHRSRGARARRLRDRAGAAGARLNGRPPRGKSGSLDWSFLESI